MLLDDWALGSHTDADATTHPTYRRGTVGRRPAADLDLSPADIERELGDAFLRVDLPGRGHSTVPAQRSDVAVERVLSFFEEKLRG